MKKLTLVAASIAAFAFVGQAAAGVIVTDPTGQFSGQYQTGTDANGNPTYAQQNGYVGVDSNGVVACNGSTTTLINPQDGTPLQGYIWVGPNNAATNPTEAAPDNVAGAGDNNKTATGTPTGKSPCPNGNPQTGVTP